MHKRLFIAVPIFCFLLLSAADAEQQEPNPPPAFSPEERFETGRFEAAFNNGVLFSPIASANNRPTINYTITELQLGYMLSDVKGPGLLRGNFETAIEGFGSAIFEGPGSFIAGVTLWGRYNFVQPGARLIPYIEGGLGLTSTDIDREIVGQPFNFNLNAGGGLRYFIATHWALSLEYRYQHISNANTGSHNIGINSHGPILGVSYLF